MDDLLLLIIVGAYFLTLCIMAFFAGQLMIIAIECLADWIERRQSGADKQAKAMPYRAKADR